MTIPKTNTVWFQLLSIFFYILSLHHCPSHSYDQTAIEKFIDHMQLFNSGYFLAAPSFVPSPQQAIS